LATSPARGRGDRTEGESRPGCLVGLLSANLYRATVKVLQLMDFYVARNETYASIVEPLLAPTNGRQIIIDLGCGRGGAIPEEAAPRIVLGVDKNRRALVEFLFHGVRRVQALADPLPVKAGVADVVVAISLVEHLPDQGAFFREVERILKPEGRVLLQIPELDFPIEPHTKWPFLRLLNRSFQSAVLAATGYEDLDLDTSVAGLRRMAAEAHLEIEREAPVWHFAVARLFRTPMGHVLIFRKASRERSAEPPIQTRS